MNCEGLSSVRPLQMYAQGSYRGIKCLNDMQGLNLNRRFELVKEVRNTGERRTWHKRATKKLLFLPFDLHLANLPLLDIH